MACNGLQPYSEDVLNDKGSKKRGNEGIVRSDPSAKNLQDRVFVVQFRDPTEPRSARFAGRAEHVMSGENTNFETREELVNFFEQVINQLNPGS
jgi:hypothetical protein